MYLKGKSGQVKIGELMSGSIQSVDVKDLSIEIWQVPACTQSSSTCISEYGTPSQACFASLLSILFMHY